MMKAYPEYTDSVIEGIDKIPSNWSVMRFRHLFSIGRGLGITKENLQDDGIPCVNYGEIHSKYGFELDLEKHPLKCVHEGYLDTSPSSLLNKGDLVYADTSEDLEGSGNFTQLISDGKTFAGYHTVIARQTRNHDDRFLAYALDSDYCRNQIRRMVKGVKVFSITQAILKDTSILLPSYEEQRAISSFLDVNTSRIDNLIAEKENFIKLLSEKRQALISHVVTKGLNPNVPMKDSGVEWIGEIPEHWEVKAIKHIATCNDDVISESTPIDSVIHYVDIGSVSKLEGITSKETIIFGDAPSRARRMVKDGDIIISTVRTYLEAIAPIVSPEKNLVVSTGFAVIRPRHIDSKFCQYSLRARHLIHQVSVESNGISYPAINSSSLMSLKVVVPKCSTEQTEIASYIDDKLTKLDKITLETSKSIELLKEHRTALISAAVTGEIDVREEA